MASESQNLLQVSDGYRGARRLTSLVCALGLGWSAAQFEVKYLSLGPAGLDLSNASFSLMLAGGIAYMTARCVIEFAMQPDSVRRWYLAQIDFKISLFLVRATFLMLAAGGLHRSVETIMYVAGGTLILMGGSFILIFIGTIALMPLRMFLRRRRGRVSAASSAIEALAWSEAIVVALVITLLVALGVASLRYEPLLSLWTVPPSPIAVGIFVATVIAIIISVQIQSSWEGKLFLRSAPCTTTALPNGTIGVTFHEKNKARSE